MHELSLMQALAERVWNVASEEGAERVVAIRLRIGRLAGVDPQALRFAAEVVLKGSCAEGAPLIIEDTPTIYWCDPCAAEFASATGLCECPGCGALSRRLLQGRECTLLGLDVVP